LQPIHAITQQLQSFVVAALPLLIRLLLVIIFTRLALAFSKSLVQRLFLPDRKRSTLNPQKAKTLETLLQSILRYAIYFLSAVTILSTMGIKTESILASAGIVGIAVGLGAQSLVRDVLTGFFIIFEDQFVVGDYVETAGLSGYVEEMGLRVTKLRDFSGVIHILPNSEISKVSNHSRGNRRALVEVAVSYEEDIEKVESVLEAAMAETARLPAVLEGPRVLGITQLGPSEIVFRIWASTKPMEQWGVERELRKNIKQAFDQAGIQPPFPRVVMYSALREGSDKDCQ
jgi:small-conductance mechanosensitive channel